MNKHQLLTPDTWKFCVTCINSLQIYGNTPPDYVPDYVANCKRRTYQSSGAKLTRFLNPLTGADGKMCCVS